MAASAEPYERVDVVVELRANSVGQCWWCDRGLIVTARGPGDVELSVRVSKPFARIGSDVAADLSLPDGGLLPCHLYLHATANGIYCLGLSDSAPSGWLAPHAIVEIGPYRIQAEFDDDGPPPMVQLADLRKSISPSPASPRIRLAADHGSGDTVELSINRPLTLVGRRAPSMICLAYRTVSRAHCVLYWNGESLWVIDLLSANATWIDRTPIDAALWRRGQKLALGDVRILRLGTDEGASDSDVSQTQRRLDSMPDAPRDFALDSRYPTLEPNEAQLTAAQDALSPQLSRREEDWADAKHAASALMLLPNCDKLASTSFAGAQNPQRLLARSQDVPIDRTRSDAPHPIGERMFSSTSAFGPSRPEELSPRWLATQTGSKGLFAVSAENRHTELWAEARKIPSETTKAAPANPEAWEPAPLPPQSENAACASSDKSQVLVKALLAAVQHAILQSWPEKPSPGPVDGLPAIDGLTLTSGEVEVESPRRLEPERPLISLTLVQAERFAEDRPAMPVADVPRLIDAIQGLENRLAQLVDLNQKQLLLNVERTATPALAAASMHPLERVSTEPGVSGALTKSQHPAPTAQPSLQTELPSGDDAAPSARFEGATLEAKIVPPAEPFAPDSPGRAGPQQAASSNAGRAPTRFADDEMLNRLVNFHSSQGLEFRRRRLIWTVAAVIAILLIGAVLGAAKLLLGASRDEAHANIPWRKNLRNFSLSQDLQIGELGKRSTFVKGGGVRLAYLAGLSGNSPTCGFNHPGV